MYNNTELRNNDIMITKNILKHTQQILLEKKYSAKTITTYLFYLKKYLDFLENKKLIDETKSVEKFLNYQKENNNSNQTFNLILNILNFFYTNVHTIVDKLDIKYKKVTKQKIQTLTKQQIIKILDSTKNEKHFLIFALSYGSGLRLNEITTLKIKNIDLKKNIIKICNKQGREVRKTILPENLKEKIEKFIINKKQTQLFFLNKAGKQLSERSLQIAFTRALIRAKIKKQTSFQVLRHSFTTHLLESGINIESLQQMLGHKNIRTTKKYKKNTHYNLTEIKSPL